jgi:hypothetical protein
MLLTVALICVPRYHPRAIGADLYHTGGNPDQVST